MMIRSLFYEQNDYSIVIVTLIAIKSAYLQMANFIVFHAYAVVLIFLGTSHIMQLLLAERRVPNWLGFVYFAWKHSLKLDRNDGYVSLVISTNGLSMNFC